MDAIELNELTKTYRNGKGIKDISLRVGEGELFGFLGPNGAGKSTTIRTIMGFLTPTSGNAKILGLDVVRSSLEVRKRVGYLPSDFSLYRDLTGWENVNFALSLRAFDGKRKAAELADRLGVDLARKTKTLSRGQRQKVAIIAALAHDPELVILDEPTTGLDPLMQEEFNNLLKELRSAGKTVFMSSHILSDVEHMCSRVAVVRDGQLVTVDSIDSLRKQRRKRVQVAFGSIVPALDGLEGVKDLSVKGNRASFTVKGNLGELLRALAESDVLDLTVEDPSLEEVFIEFYSAGEEV